MNPDHMSVDDITHAVAKLSYIEKRIKKTYFISTEVLYEESLVEIRNYDNIRKNGSI